MLSNLCQINILNRRVFFVLVFGFASGLPLNIVGSTLQAWFTKSGIDIKTIGLLSLLSLPYTLKFLWAPLIDRFRLPFLDRRRCWIVVFQMFISAGIFVLAFMDPTQSVKIIAIVAIVIAFCSASQDIAINAYQTELLEPKERGYGASSLVFGYRVAMLVSGGLALVVAGEIGWHATFIILSLLMFGHVFVTMRAPSLQYQKQPHRFYDAVVYPLKDFFIRPGIIVVVAFILTYKLGNDFSVALLSTFLLRYMDFTLADLGIMYKAVGFAATMLGLFIGGGVIAKLGLYRALIIFAVLQAFSSFNFLLFTYVGHHYSMMVYTISCEFLMAGMGTSAFLAFIMSLCNVKYTATQFALLTALSGVGVAISGPIAAGVVNAYGWHSLYVLAMVIAIPSILLLLFFKPIFIRESTHEQST